MSRISKKELKTPDQIWQASRDFLDVVLERIVPIVIGLAVLIIAIIVGVIYVQTSQKKEGSAQFHYATASAKFEQWKLETESAANKTDLKNPNAKAEKKSPEDAAKAAAQDEEEVNKELATLSKDYPHSRANRMADLIRGELAMRHQKWDEAIHDFQGYSEILLGKDKPFGLAPLARAYENRGEYDKALSVYNQILDSKNSAFELSASLGKARALKELHRTDEAKKVYEDYLQRNPRSPEAGTIRGLMALTNSVSPTANAQQPQTQQKK